MHIVYYRGEGDAIYVYINRGRKGYFTKIPSPIPVSPRYLSRKKECLFSSISFDNPSPIPNPIQVEIFKI